MLGITYEEVAFGKLSKLQLKTIANSVAFESIKSQLKNHTKVKNITFKIFAIQPYLKSDIFLSKESILLTTLKSHCFIGIQGNFKKMYQNNLCCPLNCDT